MNDGLDVYTPVLDKHLPSKIPQKVLCENCGNTHFFKDKGVRYCNKCFYSVGRVFIKDFTSKDYHHFQKKSIYKRSYHYQNKIEEISKECNLDITPEVYYKLRLDLEKIDNKLNNINETYQRQGGLEALPTGPCAAGFCCFATSSIMFQREVEFSLFSTAFYSVHF